MESNKTSGQNINQIMKDELLLNNELAKLKRVGDINNLIERFYDDLVVSSANENHVKELAELWANLATVQQIIAPERFNFAPHGKDWQSFVRNKISKRNNLLLVVHKKDDMEIRGFLYLQTVTIPSSDLILKGIIEDIYTKPQYRKQEVAFKLLDTATHWAQSQNIKQIDLIALNKTKDLFEFYSKILKRIEKNINLELLIV